MPNYRIQDLPNASSLSDGDLFETDNGTTSYNLTALQAVIYILSKISGTTAQIDFTSGVISISAAYDGQTSIDTVGRITTGTWSGKFAPRIQKIASGATATINTDNVDQYEITALATSCSINATGTPFPGQLLFLRTTDNSTPQILTFDPTSFRFQNVTAPTTTTAGQTCYSAFKWNAEDGIWDCVLNTDAIGGGGTIIGTVAASAGLVPISTGTLDEITTNVGLTYISKILTSQRTTSGPAMLAKNNSYNINGDAPLMIDDGGGTAFGLGYSTTAPYYMYFTNTGILIHGLAPGSFHYGVFFENCGFVANGKCRVGDANFNTGYEMEVAGTLLYKNQISNSSAPSVSAGFAAGTSPTITYVGTNKGGVLTITTGTGITLPAGILASVTFSGSFAAPNGSVVFIFPKSTGMSAVTAVTYASGNTTGFVLSADTGGVYVASTTYVFNVITEMF